MWHKLVSSVLILAPLQFLLASAGPATNQLVIKPNNPLIWYHGRWDEYDGSWWLVNLPFICYLFIVVYP